MAEKVGVSAVVVCKFISIYASYLSGIFRLNKMVLFGVARLRFALAKSTWMPQQRHPKQWLNALHSSIVPKVCNSVMGQHW